MKRMRTVLAVFLTLTLLLSMFCQPLEAAGINLAVGGKSGTGTSIVMPTAGLLQGLTGLMGKLGGGVQKIDGGGTDEVLHAPAESVDKALKNPFVNWVVECTEDSNRGDAFKHAYTGDGKDVTMKFCEHCTVHVTLDWPKGYIPNEEMPKDFELDVNFPFSGDVAKAGGILLPNGYGSVEYSDKDHKLKFHFSDDFLKLQNKFLKFTLDIVPDPDNDFWEDLSKKDLQIGEEQYKFDWKVKDGSISANKEIVGHEWRDGKLYFNYKVTAEVTGTGHDVDITDTLGTNLTLDQSSVKVDPDVESAKGGKVTKTDRGFTVDYGSKEFTDEEITVTYSAYLSSEDADALSKHLEKNWNLKVDANNSLRIDYKDTEDSQLHVDVSANVDQAAVGNVTKTEKDVRFYDEDGNEVYPDKFDPAQKTPKKAVLPYNVSVDLSSYYPFMKGEMPADGWTFKQVIDQFGITWEDKLSMVDADGKVIGVSTEITEAIRSTLENAKSKDGRFSIDYEYTIDNLDLSKLGKYKNTFTLKQGDQEIGDDSDGKDVGSQEYLTSKYVDTQKARVSVDLSKYKNRIEYEPDRERNLAEFANDAKITYEELRECAVPEGTLPEAEPGDFWNMKNSSTRSTEGKFEFDYIYHNVQIVDDKIQWAIEVTLPALTDGATECEVKDVLSVRYPDNYSNNELSGKEDTNGTLGTNKLDKDSFEFYFWHDYGNNNWNWKKYDSFDEFVKAYGGAGKVTLEKTDKGFTLKVNPNGLTYDNNKNSRKFKVTYKSTVTREENAAGKFYNEATGKSKTVPAYVEFKNEEDTPEPKATKTAIVDQKNGIITWKIDIDYPFITQLQTGNKPFKVLQDTLNLKIEDDLASSLEYIEGSAKISFKKYDEFVEWNSGNYNSLVNKDELDSLIEDIRDNLHVTEPTANHLVLTWELDSALKDRINSFSPDSGNGYVDIFNNAEDHLYVTFDTRIKGDAFIETQTRWDGSQVVEEKVWNTNSWKSFANTAEVTVNSELTVTDEATARIQPSKLLDKQLVYGYQDSKADKDGETQQSLFKGKIWLDDADYTRIDKFKEVDFFKHSEPYWSNFFSNRAGFQRFFFMIDVNPQQLKLSNNGTGTVTVVDTMGPAFNIYRNSIRLLEVELDSNSGNYKSGRDVTNELIGEGKFTYRTTEVVESNVETEETTFTMPDGKHYLLVYFADANVDYISDENVFDANTAKNDIKISLTGFDYTSSSTYGGHLIKMDVDAGGDANQFVFDIHKKNAGGDLLKGAKFKAVPVTVNNKEFVEDTGKATIESNESGDDGDIAFIGLRKDVIYRIEEIQAPAGYGIAPPVYVIYDGKDMRNANLTAFEQALGLDHDKFIASTNDLCVYEYKGETCYAFYVKNTGKYVDLIDEIEEITGSLSVLKKVEGVADANTAYTFTVELTPAPGTEADALKEAIEAKIIPVSGGEVVKRVAGGVVTITAQLKKDEKLSITEIPVDTRYTVTETKLEGYEEPEFNGATSGTITANDPGKDIELTCTNTVSEKTGKLSITKLVKAGTVSGSGTFSFVVVLTNDKNEPVSGTFGDATFDAKGEHAFNLNANETKEISGIPVGTKYEVYETDDKGTKIVADGIVDDYKVSYTNQTGEIKEDTAQVTVTNTQLTSLVLKKTVSGEDTGEEFTFNVKLTAPTGYNLDGVIFDENKADKVENKVGEYTVTLKNKETCTFSNLPYGTSYEITENANANYTTSIKDSNATKATGKASGNTVEFINTRKTGSFSVTKEVTGEGADKTKPFEFTVTLTKDGKPYTGTYVEDNSSPKEYTDSFTFTLKNGDTKTFSGIPVGVHYEVEEKDYAAENYTNETGTITGDVTLQIAAHTVTNTYTKPGTGSIKVTKKVDGGVDSVENREFKFTITLTPDGISAEDLNEAIDVTNGNSAVDGNTVKVTGTVNANGFVEVKNISLNTKYSVEEIGFDSNVFEKNEFDGSTTGTIDVSGKVVTLTCINTLKKGSLKVTKTVINTEDKDVFHFTVTLTDSNGNPISGEFSDIVFNEDGVGTFTLEANTSKTIEGLPVGTKYAVTETDANTNNYTTSYTDCEGVIGVGDKPAEAVVTNTKTEEKTGELVVTKSSGGEYGNNKVDENAAFRIVVELSDKSFNTTSDDDSLRFTSGVAEVYLKFNQSAKATGIPAGTTYTVAEYKSDGTKYEENGVVEGGYKVSYTWCEGKIEADKTSRAIVTNAKKAGDLKVTKNVNAKDYDGRTFTIKVSTTPAVVGTYGEMTFDNSGVATIYLADGESKTAEGLPEGTSYEVYEVDKDNNKLNASDEVDGFTVTYSGATGTIQDSAVAVEAVVTNSKDIKLGSLTLTKLVAGENPDLTKAFTFSVKLTAPTGENIIPPGYIADNQGYFTVELTADKSVTIENLPVGTSYIIMENDYSAEGYTGTVTEGTPIGVIVEGDTRVTYTNTKAATTSLMVRKELSGTAITPADAEQLFTFHVALSAPAGGEQLQPSYEYEGKIATADATGVYVVNLKGGEVFVFMNLPDGTTYTVTEVEANQNGFTTVIPDNASGALDTNSCPIVTFVNSKELRETSLTVRKTVQGDDADYSKAFNFTVTLEGYTGPYTLNGVEAVTENGIITFTLMSGQSATIAGIPENTVYSVTELEANADGYVTNVNGSQNGVLTPDTESSVEFVNAKWKEAPKTGSLTVRKTVTGTAAEYGRRFSFTVMLSDTSVTGIYGQMNFVGGVASFALAHGESITATDLPAGITYTVFENDAGDYIQNSMGATGMITENGFAEAMFINTKDKEEKYGDLSVTKTVTGEGYDPAQQFNFTVTLSDSSVNGQYGDMNFVGGVASFTLTNGQTAYAAQLPADIFYTVTEEPTENYISTATGDTGAIVGDSMVYAEFVNEYVAPRVGGFNITKLVTGTAGDLNRFFTFRVVLSDASINGVYGDIAFADGFATVFLRSGMTVYCDGLPEGTGYSVIELDSDDYMVTYTNAAGTVEVGTSIPVTIINHKDIPEIPEEHEEDQPNPHDDDMNAGVGGDRPHGDDMNAGVGGNRPHGDDMNPATGDFELEHYSNAFITITVLWAMVFIFGAVVLADKRRRDK